MSDDATRGRWHGRRPAVAGIRVAGLVVLGVVGAGIFALAFGWLVMILWNWIMPGIFSLPAIGYWKAFGIVILAKLIFGAVGGGRHWGPRPWGHGPGPMGGRHGPGRDWRLWRQYWDEEGRQAYERYAEHHASGVEPRSTSGVEPRSTSGTEPRSTSGTEPRPTGGGAPPAQEA